MKNNELEKFGQLLDRGFGFKRKMAKGISNEFIENIYNNAIHAGAFGGKISGAGGGGFMVFYTSKEKKVQVIETLEQFGEVRNFKFENQGLRTWSNS